MHLKPRKRFDPAILAYVTFERRRYPLYSKTKVIRALAEPDDEDPEQSAVDYFDQVVVLNPGMAFLDDELLEVRPRAIPT